MTLTEEGNPLSGQSLNTMKGPVSVTTVLLLTWGFTSMLHVKVSTDGWSNPSCQMSPQPITGNVSRPGDLVIGGTFLIHVEKVYSQMLFRNRPELKCQTFEFEYYQRMQALIFAVEEINSRSDLLPNITLGFQIFDTCAALRRTVEGTLWMLSGGGEIIPNYQCQEKTRLAGIISFTGSTRSIIMTQILDLYRYPQLSYFSTSPFLSSMNQFSSISSNEAQYRGLAQLVTYFGWSWIGLLATDDDYGQVGVQLVKKEIIASGACVAFVENILTGHPKRNAPNIAQVIRKSVANVVIVLSSPFDFLPVVEELIRQNVSGKTWVASESWSTSALLSKERFQQIMVGTVGFSIHGGQMPGFTEYLNSLHPSKHLNDAFVNEFWEKIFSCTWVGNEDSNTTQKCTGREKFENSLIKADLSVTFNVYTCVYAIAWALKSLLQCKPGQGPFQHGACADMPSLRPWQVHHYVKNVNFHTKDGRHIFFNDKGSSPSIYGILNWQLEVTQKLKQVLVGIYNSSAPPGSTLMLYAAAIRWNREDIQIPYSKCSSGCPTGFQKVTIPGKPACCYECVPCPLGKISNRTDAVECHQCTWDMWPNHRKDRCLPRAVEFLSYTDTMGISLATIALFSCTIPVCILVIFLCQRTTPIVRANNWSISCLLLVSLSFCFLCPLAFIGYPQTEICLMRQVVFGMVFALCISCVLAKTIIVVIAFNATKPGTWKRKHSGAKVSYSVMISCVFIQLVICVMWLSFFPPFPEYDTQTQSGIIVISCNEGSTTAFWCMVGYLGVLATLSFIVAFLARRLPDSFNETKFITFSMLAFLSVWVSFVPAYLSARGKNTVAMEIFAILSSSWAVVICIFFPKCFIILFRPKINSREYVMQKTKRQA